MINSYIMPEQGNMKISEHFKVKEFACKDGSPVAFVDSYLICLLENLRRTIEKPVIITRGYRTPEHNKKIGGAKYSYHIRGCAADIIVKGMTPKEVAMALNKIAPGDSCGIIVERGWTHFDVRRVKYRKGV